MSVFKWLKNRWTDIVSVSKTRYIVRIGPFDPLQLIFNLMDQLLRENKITPEQAKTILRNALPPDSEMSPEEKEKIVSSMITQRKQQDNQESDGK